MGLPFVVGPFPLPLHPRPTEGDLSCGKRTRYPRESNSLSGNANPASQNANVDLRNPGKEAADRSHGGWKFLFVVGRHPHARSHDQHRFRVVVGAKVTHRPVAVARRLDRPRTKAARRVTIDQQRQHHPWGILLAPAPPLRRVRLMKNVLWMSPFRNQTASAVCTGSLEGRSPTGCQRQ
jgi:hypothetical protein